LSVERPADQLGQTILASERTRASRRRPLERILKHCARNRPPRTETAGSANQEQPEKTSVPATTLRRGHHFFRLWLRPSRVRIPSLTPTSRYQVSGFRDQVRRSSVGPAAAAGLRVME
jgi:hypothetical protein